MQCNKDRSWPAPAWSALLGVAGFLSGCASPGTPRPPSLHLPAIVQDLAATREGASVQLRFTVPTHTSDGVLIRSATVSGVLCRQDEKAGPCHELKGSETNNLWTPGSVAALQDILSPALQTGVPRLLAYRVELRNQANKSAGYSEAAYAPAGSAPPTVERFTATGVRAGVLLAWQPAAGSSELMVRREPVDRPAGVRANQDSDRSQSDAKPAGIAKLGNATEKKSRAKTKAESDAIWLSSGAGTPAGSQMIDGTIEEGVTYRYTAVRSETVHLGGRTLQLRSEPSLPVEFAWRDVYPPGSPHGLTALAFRSSPEQAAAPAYAVDLIWEPVNDPRVSGYVVRRQQIDAEGHAVSPAELLTPQPLAAPGFHDASAKPGTRYEYAVTAVDAKGNVSPPATASAVTALP